MRFTDSVNRYFPFARVSLIMATAHCANAEGVAVLGSLIILYLFLGGAAGGALLVMSAWSLAHYRNDSRSHRFRRAFKSLQKSVYTIGTLLLVFSMLCLMWDLWYPERALLMFTRARPTILTFGAFVLAADVLIGFVLAAVNLLDLKLVGGRMRKALEAVCCVLSCCVMLYTGAFLANNGSVAFWHTWTLVPLFFFSSFSAGISVVLLIDYFVQDQTLLLQAAKPLQRAHLTCLALEAVFLALFAAHAFDAPRAAGSLALLLEPSMLSTAIIGVLGLGLLVPFTLELYSLRRTTCRTIPVSDVVCLIGCLCLRYCIAMCGVH